jgi:hypothetical protein
LGDEVAFPPEFDLLVACCRRPLALDPVRRGAVGIDWDFFLRVAERHRVDGLAFDALRRAEVALPPEISARLAAAAAVIARDNLFQAAEALRLAAALAAAGVDHLFIKGLTLNALAYRSLALKRAVDIDILVDPDSYDAALDVMEAAGYRCIHPEGAGRAEILLYAETVKDSGWRSPAGIIVELHKRLTANPVLLPTLSVRSPRQIVEIAPGIRLPTLARDELVAYLMVHGGLTAWSRLKWPADLAALLADADEAEVERLYLHATALAPGRSAAQALLVCSRLFGTALSPALAERLRADPLARYLEKAALKTMVQGGAATELHDQRLGTARLNLSILFLHRGWRYKAAELRRKLRRAPAALRRAAGGGM